MTKTDTIAIFGLGIVIGCFLGLMANGELYYFAGKKTGYGEAKKEAMQWAKEELKRHCPSWHTDRRQHDYIACHKPEWMK